MPVVVFLRGDHQVNETKLMALVHASELRPMMEAELQTVFHAPAVFWGRWD